MLFRSLHVYNIYKRRGCESSQQLKQRNAWIAHRKRRPKDSQVSSPSSNATVTGCEMDARVQIYIYIYTSSGERENKTNYLPRESINARGDRKLTDVRILCMELRSSLFLSLSSFGRFFVFVSPFSLALNHDVRD
uniref:Uncharacterized protein n=1 Tax=Trichogramma kaykai TaxID=54128 RepID=A0ABD2X5H8_9HYME